MLDYVHVTNFCITITITTTTTTTIIIIIIIISQWPTITGPQSKGKIFFQKFWVVYMHAARPP